jgi:hypothetical protein
MMMRPELVATSDGEDAFFKVKRGTKLSRLKGVDLRQ